MLHKYGLERRKKSSIKEIYGYKKPLALRVLNKDKSSHDYSPIGVEGRPHYIVGKQLIQPRNERLSPLSKKD